MKNGNDPTMAFGDRLVAHAPLIRKLSNHYCRKHPGNGSPEDFAQDVYELALRRQANYDGRYALSTWLYYLCAWVASDRATKNKSAAGRARHVELDAKHYGSCAPNQLEYTELSQVLRHLTGRGGEALKRIAIGDEMPDIAKDMGVTRQRVFQLCQAERQRLAVVMAEAA